MQDLKHKRGQREEKEVFRSNRSEARARGDWCLKLLLLIGHRGFGMDIGTSKEAWESSDDSVRGRYMTGRVLRGRQ